MCFWFGRDKNIKTVKELAQKCKTPHSLSIWTRRNITYKDDYEMHGVKDYWQTSEETLLSRMGDCEDFAILQHDVLKILGFDPQVIVVCDSSQAHGVCVYREKGVMYHMSNWKMKACHGAKEIKDIGRYVFRNWRIIEVYDVTDISNGRARIIQRIFRGVDL